MIAILGLTALAMIGQAFILLGILLSVRRLSNSLKDEIEDLRSSVIPVCVRAGDLLARTAPQLEATITDLAEVANSLRGLTAQVDACTKDILGRVRHQTSRLDAMLSTVLDGVDKASVAVAEAVVKPARQLSGLFAFANAAIDSLRGARTVQGRTVPRHSGDERIDDRFV
ncbi:MAG: hypothetical protein ABR956_00295 [Terracidiphilus sp.]